MLILHSVNRVLCTLCKLHTASTEQCSQFIVLIVHNFKKVLFTLARIYLHKKVHISTVRGVLHKVMKVHIVHIFQCNAWLHSEQLAGRTFCIEDNLHSGRFVQDICLMGYLSLWEPECFGTTAWFRSIFYLNRLIRAA